MGNLLSFEGRTRRRDWWLYNVVVGLIGYAISQVIAPMALGDQGRVIVDPASPFTPHYPMPLLLVMLGTAAVFLWPNLAIAARRTHDRDKSARLNLILFGICSVLGWIGLFALSGAVPALADIGGLPLLTMLVNLVVGIYLLVVLGFLDGTPGPNRFGPSPKDAQPPSTPHADYS